MWVVRRKSYVHWLELCRLLLLKTQADWICVAELLFSALHNVKKSMRVSDAPLNVHENQWKYTISPVEYIISEVELMIYWSSEDGSSGWKIPAAVTQRWVNFHYRAAAESRRTHDNFHLREYQRSVRDTHLCVTTAGVLQPKLPSSCHLLTQ